MPCPKCHAVVSDASRFCPACGTAQPDPDATGAYAPSAPSRPAERFAPGTILAGQYRIVAALGKGGMGEVYRADDLTLGQSVALKFLPLHLTDDPDRRSLFHAEVRSARQVSHPHVCRVYDLTEADGQLFLTMEYIDGQDLAGLLRQAGRLPEVRAGARSMWWPLLALSRLSSRCPRWSRADPPPSGQGQTELFPDMPQDH